MSEIALQTTRLTKQFRIKKRRAGLTGALQDIVAPHYKVVTAVDNLSFCAQQGEIVAFIGPNGAGKSTTLKMLTGILYPTSGDMRVLGLNPLENRSQIALQTGSVFGQKGQLWYHLPAIESYDFFSHMYELDKKTYRKRLAFLADMFDIGEIITRPVRKLSLGQRMLCEITASLLHSPKILFLDEPTIGLDVIAKKRVRDAIAQLNKEERTTILLTSHDVGDIENLSTRSVIINHGTIVFDDATATLKRNYLTHKIVELVVQERVDNISLPLGTIIEQSTHSFKVTIESSGAAIQELIKYVAGSLTLEDITITDPPLEEIITAIYRQPRMKT